MANPNDTVHLNIDPDLVGVIQTAMARLEQCDGTSGPRHMKHAIEARFDKLFELATDIDADLDYIESINWDTEQ